MRTLRQQFIQQVAPHSHVRPVSQSNGHTKPNAKQNTNPNPIPMPHPNLTCLSCNSMN